MSLAIGIPAHDGRLLVETADGLLQCRDLYDSVIWLKGCCFPSQARNLIVYKFLSGTWDRLLFIDTDIVFERRHMEQLLAHDKDIVAGVYTGRSIEDNRIFIHPLGDKIQRGFKEAVAAATGFMLIRRRSFEVIRDSMNGEWMWADKAKTQKMWDYFACGRVVQEHDWASDDFAFCNRARKAGLSVWVDTDIAVGHMGQVVFGVQ